MTLQEFKKLLQDQGDKLFQLRLPAGGPVPVSFHVTEVGRVQKTFIDCGGTLREQVTCQLQIWVGQDDEHRIEAKKTAKILEKARAFLPDESVPVEFEYEDRVLSQYKVKGYEVLADAVVLQLVHKHTECLAPELCGLPSAPKISLFPAQDSCCSGSGCC